MNKSQKLAALAAGIKRLGWSWGRMELLVARIPHVSIRSACALLRDAENAAEVARLAGAVKVVYSGASYYASGNGAFGRLRSGRAGQYNKPTVRVEWS